MSHQRCCELPASQIGAADRLLIIQLGNRQVYLTEAGQRLLLSTQRSFAEVGDTFNQPKVENVSIRPAKR